MGYITLYNLPHRLCLTFKQNYRDGGGRGGGECCGGWEERRKLK